MFKCNKCQGELDFKDSKPNYWKKGEEGTKYKWNKVGAIKDYYIPCKKCGYKNEYMPL